MKFRATQTTRGDYMIVRTDSLRPVWVASNYVRFDNRELAEKVALSMDVAHECGVQDAQAAMRVALGIEETES